MTCVRSLVSIGCRPVKLAILFVLATSSLHAQLNVELTPEVTEIQNAFRYEYTLGNSFGSSVAVNGFLLTVGGGGDHVTDLTGPEGWEAFYDPAERNLQVAWLSNEGQFDIAPGREAVFGLTSRFAPGEADYFIARFTEDFTDVLGLAVGDITVPSVPPAGGPPCDFDQSGVCDLVDIDALGQVIAQGTNDATFDLTGEGVVDMDDLDSFLQMVNRFNGDADFSGAVAFGDFLRLSGNFGKEGVVWSDGDFAPNNVVEFSDFLILGGNFGLVSEELAAATVPEPSTPLLTAVGLFGLLATRRGWRI